MDFSRIAPSDHVKQINYTKINKQCLCQALNELSDAYGSILTRCVIEGQARKANQLREKMLEVQGVLSKVFVCREEELWTPVYEMPGWLPSGLYGMTASTLGKLGRVRDKAMRGKRMGDTVPR